MIEYRIHLMTNTEKRLTRCGRSYPKNWVIRATESVTCKTCLKLLKGEVK